MAILHLNDRFGDFTEIWRCPMPPSGLPFIVDDDEWSADGMTRTIYKIHLVHKEVSHADGTPTNN